MYDPDLLTHKRVDYISIDKETKCDKCRRICVVFQPIFYLALIGIACFLLFSPKWPWSVTIRDGIQNDVITESSVYTGDALNDLVTDLPGLIDDIKVNHFSGYLDALEGRQIHYQFFEAQSDPYTSPVFIWTNGGPGCSGLEGIFNEHGPVWIYDDLSLKINPYSWNTLVNMVYIEQPYGVGFSINNDDETVISGDENAAKDMDAAIRSFLTKFDIFLKNNNKIYITAESWGGHYMPITALRILKNNDNGYTPHINFGGFFVGNPYTNEIENEVGFMEATYGHGLMKYSTYNSWRSNCWGNDEAIANSNLCNSLYVSEYLNLMSGIDVYALDFPYCSKNELLSKKHRLFHKHKQRKIKSLLRLKDNEFNELNLKISKDELKIISDNIDKHGRPMKNDNDIDSMTSNPYVSCGEYDMTKYLNQEDVQSALHVSNIEWEMCSDKVYDAWPDSDWSTSMESKYIELVNNYDIDIVIYSGDDDSVCGLQGTQYWLNNIGWTIDKSIDYNIWKLNNDIAGFHTKFLKSNNKIAINFYSVHSAGHMVPQTQPERALKVLEMYLNNINDS